MKTRVPISVTLIAFTVLIFTAWNGLRLYETILNWELLIKYDSQPGPLYMALFSSIWIIASLVVLIELLKGNSRRWLSILKITTIIFTFWFWLDRLSFQKTQLSNSFPLGFTILMLLFMSMLLNHRHTQFYIKQRETHDR